MTTSVVADGTEIINALDLIDDEGDPIPDDCLRAMRIHRLQAR
jgi:hypothetical protein